MTLFHYLVKIKMRKTLIIENLTIFPKKNELKELNNDLKISMGNTATPSNIIANYITVFDVV